MDLLPKTFLILDRCPTTTPPALDEFRLTCSNHSVGKFEFCIIQPVLLLANFVTHGYLPGTAGDGMWHRRPFFPSISVLSWTDGVSLSSAIPEGRDG